MKKGRISKKVLEDIYVLRALFEHINSDYDNDRGSNRAELIHQHTKEGVELCNDYINQNDPLQ